MNRKYFLNTQIRIVAILVCSMVMFNLHSLAQQSGRYNSFRPGQDLIADDGKPIDCHGGNIIYVDSLKTFFWYGEHYGTPRGVACYSSTDLYKTEKAYIGYAADHVNRTIRMVELTSDYLDVSTNDVDIEAHCEGPGILKKDGKYYLLTSGCTGWTPNRGHYYTSTSITGPYELQGSPFIGDAGDNSFNSQPCYIFKIPGYKNAYLYMGDRWNGFGGTHSQYVFLPITITASAKMELHFYREWDLSLFTPEKKRLQR